MSQIREMKPKPMIKVFARDPTLSLDSPSASSSTAAPTATVPKSSKTSRNEAAEDEQEIASASGGGTSGFTVKTSRSYHLQNEEQTEVEAEQQVLAYRFGSSIVPFSDDDRANMQYSCNKCFQILGFTASRNVRLITSCIVFLSCHLSSLTCFYY